MNKKFVFLLLFSFVLLPVNATHNRAGEITFRQISAYTYEFTVTTFTYAYSVVETSPPYGRISLDISWGDNTTSSAPRKTRVLLPENITYYRNTYIVTHTFPGPGVYEIVMQDPNRNFGVKNIPNSVNVIFSVKTTMIVNPQFGSNSTPVLLNYPIDKAALHRIFIHNPSAFDYDGDSLSYKLTTCTKEGGKPIENYTFPEASRKLYVDSITGDLVWDAPQDTGIYNIAMNVEEWRNGVKIGNIERDMQVEVHQSNNNPPVNPVLPNLCVEAGQLIDFTFTTTDPDNDLIKDTLTGGPFILKSNPAKEYIMSSGPGYTNMRFYWQTDYSHARRQPYNIVVKGVDNYEKLNLVDIKNFQIRVMAPSPKGLITYPGNNSISLRWNKSVCPRASGYEIYRAAIPVAFNIDSCVGGISKSSGYVKIDNIKSITDTTYLDNNHGQSLSLGINYCYRVVAVFPDGLRSYPSDESCTMLKPGTPSLTSASVTKIDPVQGEVFLSWIKPHSLDTLPIPAVGPYEYLIYRSDKPDFSTKQLISTIQTVDLSDTAYIDNGINTIQYPYFYKIELYNNAPGNRFQIGTSETASTMYPDLLPSDNQLTIKFAKNIPWINTRYIIYRQNLNTLAFDSIGYADSEEYVDKGLANGQTYRYRLKAYGYRQLGNVKFYTLNWSHINSSFALDTIRPCTPMLHVSSVCDSMVNILKWPNSNLYCADDVIKYNVYFKPSIDGPFKIIETIDNKLGDTIYYRHSPPETLAGCYAVSAVDSFNNESYLTNESCVDYCTGYQIPNVFTPNNDDINDKLVAINPANYVKSIEIKVFNRWGKLVFKTTDPAINWDGIDIYTKQYVSTGVYFYVCDIYEPRLTGIVVRNISGFVHVYYSESDKILIK